MASSMPAQEKPPVTISADEYPILEKYCRKQQQDWGGKSDWQASCRLAVWKEVKRVDANGEERIERHGHILFDLPLILPRPASYDECEDRVRRWMFKDSLEMLRRVGWLKGKK